MDLREVSTELLCSLKGNPLRYGNQFSSESCMKVSCFLQKFHLQSCFLTLVVPDFSAINIPPTLTRWDRLGETYSDLTPAFPSRGRVARPMSSRATWLVQHRRRLNSLPRNVILLGILHISLHLD